MFRGAHGWLNCLLGYKLTFEKTICFLTWNWISLLLGQNKLFEDVPVGFGRPWISLHFEQSEKKTEIMNIRLFGNSLVGVLQLLDLPLQLKVVSAACRHPAEWQENRVEREEGGGKRKVSHNNVSRCRIISFSFLSLPISVWMHECYLTPVVSSSVSIPTSAVSHFSFWSQWVTLHYGPSDCTESSLIMMPYWYALLAYGLITNKCWHHPPLTISHHHKTSDEQRQQTSKPDEMSIARCLIFTTPAQ